MLDPKFIRENIDLVRKSMKAKGETADLDRFLVLDEQRRKALAKRDELKHRRNVVSDEIGTLRKEGKEAKPQITEMQKIGERIKELEEKIRQLEQEFQEVLLSIPNIPHPSVPVGKDESENVVRRTEGVPTCRDDFEPLPHWELGERLGIIDFVRGVKISGTRFYVLTGLGAKLQRALISWMLDLHIKDNGYKEVYPPYLVKRECLIGTGQLPKFGSNLYHDTEDDFWFIPTAEVPVTNLHRNEILPPDSLPIYYVAYSACFRREEMSAGKDTRGIKRGHQFDKVELVKFVEPEKSDEELEKLVKDAEEIPKRLGIAYRIVEMCTGDLGFTAIKKYDIEMWAPGCKEWLEVSSCSNFGDFQARRANIKFRRQPGSKPEFVHTLNGSGLALPRTLISVLENYQQPDGSILIPEVLRPYVGEEKIT